MDHKKAIENIRRELKTYVVKHNLKSLVLGVSGGIDSCLCAALAKPVCDELNIPLIGASLPTMTNENSENIRAETTGKLLCTKFYIEPINDYYAALNKINPAPQDTKDKDWLIRNGNIKARIRMIYLFNLASMNKGLVLSTDNYTEFLLGFWTRFGDEGDFGMIQELWKTEVYELAEYIATTEYQDNPQIKSIILDTINAMATDGLGVSNLGDLGQILPGFTGDSREGYNIVDNVLHNWIFELPGSSASVDGYTSIVDHPVIGRHLGTEFKRNVPVNINRNLILN